MIEKSGKGLRLSGRYGHFTIGADEVDTFIKAFNKMFPRQVTKADDKKSK